MAAISAISTAADISAKNQQAEAEQDAAVQRQVAMNAQRVQEMEETNRKASLELTEEKRKSLQAQAKARVASAESGAMGGVALRNLANVYMQEGINSGSIISLAESDIVRIGTQSQADFLQTRSSINVAESQKSTGLSAALQIGASASQGYAAGGGFSDGMTWSKSADSFKNTWTFG